MPTINCPNCRREIPSNVAFCPDCGAKLVVEYRVSVNTPPQQGNSNVRLSGGFGIAGFILSLLSVGFSTTFTFVTVFLSILGIIFSGIGMSKRRRVYGLGIAGLVISLLALLTSPFTCVYSCLTNSMYGL